MQVVIGLMASPRSNLEGSAVPDQSNMSVANEKVVPVWPAV